MWTRLRCPHVSYDELHDSSASAVDSRTNHLWSEVWSPSYVESMVDVKDVVDVG